MDSHDLTNPHLVTYTGDLSAQPQSEPLTAGPQVPTLVCDPRDFLLSEFVHRAELVQEGDWIAAEGWSRPRLVVTKDSCSTGHILCLADPDDSRTNSHRVRRIDAEGWRARGKWRRYPNLAKVWAAAHSA